MWSEPRRAHPAGVIVTSFRYLGSLFAPITGSLFALGAIVEDIQAVIGSLLIVLGLILTAVIAMVLAWVHWYRFTFQVGEGGSLRVEQGLLVRKSTRLSPERIQSVSTKANLLFRVLGLVTVDIHTAGRGHVPEVSIAALTEDEARELAGLLRPARAAAGQAVETGEESVHAPQGPAWRLSGTELAIVALTSSGGLIALAALAPLLGAIIPMLPESVFNVEMVAPATTVLITAAGIISALLVIAWVVGSIGTALQYWDFVAIRADEEVRVERGLLQRNTRNVPLDRVQAVRFTEGLLRQAIGRVTVGVDAAGIGSGGELGPTVLHPLLTSDEVRRFGEVMVPGHTPPRLRPLPARSLRRYVFRATIGPLIVGVLITLLLPYGWLALLLPCVAALWGIWMFRDAAWGVFGEVLAIRWRSVARTTAFVRRRRVQSVSVSQHPLQRIAGLATLSVRVAASPTNATFTVRHLGEADAMSALEWVSEGVEQRGDQGAGETPNTL
jgi:putative membrane protein